MKLDGLFSLVTGGARGIGAAIAEALRAEGSSVVVADIEGGDIAVDVRDEAAVEAAIDRFERLDILVNNAALIPPTSLWEISREEWDDVIAVNLRGAFFASRAAARRMRNYGFGRIVNIASIAGQAGGLVGGAHYSASKAGLVVLTKVFARELASYGITVNAVAPAAIESRALDELPEERRTTLVDSIPAGRLGRAEEVAAAVVYLASREAGFVTGATLDVNGGLLMRS